MTDGPEIPAPAAFAPLREQLLSAAEAFSGGGAAALGGILSAMVADVERAMAERLEIFPVCHHSPAAALHIVRRLRTGPAPKVIFIELCEDLLPVLDKVEGCKLPVALQAFAGKADAFPRAWAPLSVVAPLTEFSAEYQAICYARTHPDTALVFVDRSVDLVFQWMPQDDQAIDQHLPDGDAAPDDTPAEEGEETAAPAVAHGQAVGVQVGSLEPTFPLFLEFLLKNARVRFFTEWWERYVEQPLLGADYVTYRQVMCLVGSLLRRLGRRQQDNDADRLRERFMWTRMKDYLDEHGIAPAEALHICGAFHAVSDVEEYGTHTRARWTLPPRSDTAWLYGILPSSHRSIDWQFGFPPGTVTLSEAQWERSKRAMSVQPFGLGKADSPKADGKKGKKKGKASAPAPVDETSVVHDATPVGGTAVELGHYLTRPCQAPEEDHEQLLGWCIGIVHLAHRNGYLTSTADTIALFHTSVLLAQLRNRTSPTPYDFRDAAVTCLEKERTPGKRDIARLCDILLGGDRIGRVGRDSLPPLAQNVLDRLAPIGLNFQSTTVQRALLDYRKNPELLVCSGLLWQLWYLLGNSSVKPIMGEKVLGQTPIQESWEVYIGRNQTPVITLGYEGVTVEQVLDKRLRVKAFGPGADTIAALAAVEESLLFLGSPRLEEEIGQHAVTLLAGETGAQSAPQIFERVRRLIHYFRSTKEGLPAWIQRFVTAGYAHYTTLLPTAFSDQGTTPGQVAGMLAFVFTLESLALSLGCQRSQLAIAVRQSATGDVAPDKAGLLWTAEWLLSLRTVGSIREFFDELLANALTTPSMPAYLSGFVLALKFTPLVGPLVVELVSKAFARLPFEVLMPWLPGLVMMLRSHGQEVLPPLLKEAGRTLPERHEDLAAWSPPWEQAPHQMPLAPRLATERSSDEGAVYGLLRAYPAAASACCGLLGAEPVWEAEALPPSPAGEHDDVPSDRVSELLRQYPSSMCTLAVIL